MGWTKIFKELMEDHALSTAQVADLCDVTEDIVAIWLEDGDYKIPKSKVCMLTNIGHLQKKHGLTDARIAAMAGMPIEYIAVWKEGSLPVPQGIMLKMLKEGG